MCILDQPTQPHHRHHRRCLRCRRRRRLLLLPCRRRRRISPVDGESHLNQWRILETASCVITFIIPGNDARKQDSMVTQVSSWW